MKCLLYSFLLVTLSSCSTSSQQVNKKHDIIEDGLVLFLKFDKSSIADLSKFNNVARIFGAQHSTDRHNSSRSALYFDGINSYLEVRDADKLSPIENNLSISLWFKTRFSSNKFIMYKGSKLNNREYAIAVTSDNLISFQINSNGKAKDRSFVTTKSIIEDDVWYNLICVWDGTHQKIYLNGKLEDETMSDAKIKNFNSDLYIGTYGGSKHEYAFRGVLDEIMIFNRVLSENEIEVLSEF